MTEPDKHWLVVFQKDSGLTFFVLLPLMKRTLTISLDVDWLWRRFGGALAREFALHGGKAQRLTGNQVQKTPVPAMPHQVPLSPSNQFSSCDTGGVHT